MRNLGRAALLLVTASLLPLQSFAESRFCIGGDTSNLNVSQKKACMAELAQVQTLAKRFHAPDDWHFVMVCDAAGWSDYAAFSQRSQTELVNASADTDLAEQSTFFRGDRLSTPNASRFERVVAHEIAGIKLHTADEFLIEQQLATWLPEHSLEPPVLTASR